MPLRGEVLRGTLLVPLPGDVAPPDDDPALARVAGADLLADVPAVADWLDGVAGRLVVGNYRYADGATHVRVTMAADILAQPAEPARPDLALAFLAIPTDTFVFSAGGGPRSPATRAGPSPSTSRPPDVPARC